MSRALHASRRPAVFLPRVADVPIIFTDEASVVDLGHDMTVHIVSGPDDDLMFAGTTFLKGNSVGQAHTGHHWDKVFIRCLAEALDSGHYPLPPGFEGGKCTIEVIDLPDRKELRLKRTGIPLLFMSAQLTDRACGGRPVWHALGGPGRVSYPNFYPTPGDALLKALQLRKAA